TTTYKTTKGEQGFQKYHSRQQVGGGYEAKSKDGKVEIVVYIAGSAEFGPYPTSGTFYTQPYKNVMYFYVKEGNYTTTYNLPDGTPFTAHADEEGRPYY